MGKKNCIKYGLMVIGILGVVVIIAINLYVKLSTSSRITEINYYNKMEKFDCVLVLGAGVLGDKPSPMLEERLQKGIIVYKYGLVNKIIMTGDHIRKEYDEVNVMKKFAIDRGVPSEDIFMDHAGLSTYDSIYRAKEVFEAKRIFVVTQRYHLPRALYIAKKLGVDAYGIEADIREYRGKLYRETREILARNKDFVKCLFRPKPYRLGDKIPVSGDGNITNDG